MDYIPHSNKKSHVGFTIGTAPNFEKAIAIFHKIKAENELAVACSGTGRLHKLRGECTESRRQLTQALEIFECLGTLIEPDKVRKGLEEFRA